MVKICPKMATPYMCLADTPGHWLAAGWQLADSWLAAPESILRVSSGKILFPKSFGFIFFSKNSIENPKLFFFRILDTFFLPGQIFFTKSFWFIFG